jgi:hypothetical protein
MSLKGTAFRPYIIAQNSTAFEATENSGPGCSPGLLVRGSGFSNPLKRSDNQIRASALVAASQPVRDFCRSLFSR